MSTTFAPSQPEQTTIATVRQVDQRVVNKSDGTSFTLYEVFVQGLDQPFTTSKRAIAESAFELVGYPAEISYNVKVNGNFTNWWLQRILPPPANAATAAQRAATADPLLRQAAGLPQSQPPVGPTDKDRSIHRQVAAKVAASLVTEGSSSADFWNNVRALAHYFDTGDAPGTQPAQPGPMSNYDDDIPFAPTLGPYGL